jgi:hypothetical protein
VQFGGEAGGDEGEQEVDAADDVDEGGDGAFGGVCGRAR